MTEFITREVQANGLRFHYLEMGEGPLALCLHGFPDSPYSYRYLLPELAERLRQDDNATAAVTVLAGEELSQ